MEAFEISDTLGGSTPDWDSWFNEERGQEIDYEEEDDVDSCVEDDDFNDRDLY